MFVVYCLLFAVCCLMVRAWCWPFVVRCVIFVGCCSVFVCWLADAGLLCGVWCVLVVRCVLCVVCCLLSVVY